jgi:hypothetical protein
MAQRQPAAPWSQNLNINALHLMNKRNEQIQQVMTRYQEADVQLNPQEDDDRRTDRTDLFKKMLAADAFMLYTGLSVQVIDSIYQTMQQFEHEFHRRGPPPKINNMDAFLMLLTWCKAGGTLDAVAMQFGQPASTFRETIVRIRPMVHKALKHRWNPSNFRPEMLNDNEFPHVALLIDSTSTQIPRPSRIYCEAKPYWDGKNAIYALKKEVAVTAHAPHYALFAQPATRGGVHDFTIFKEHFSTYLPYLVKTAAERIALATDQDNEAWAVLADKAYYTINNQQDSPGIRRITPLRKAKLTLAERQRNEKISRLRVPVECFFGRMQKKWAITEGRYRLDHEHFDQDFEICMWLTNEEIRSGVNLEQSDYDYYVAVYNSRLIIEQAKSKKRTDSQRTYYARKKTRMTRKITLTVNNNIYDN